MSQWFTDFREYLAANWTSLGEVHYNPIPANVWDDGYWYNPNSIIVEGGTGTLGDQDLKLSVGVDNYVAFAWEQVGSLSGTHEVLAKVKFVGTVTNTINIGAGICIGGSAGSEDGYLAYLSGYGTPGLQLMKRDGGVQTDLAGDSSAGLASNTWYWIRLKRDATNVYAKYWADGGAEPGSWGINVADTALTSGYVGVVFQDNKDHYCDQFSVGSGTDAAPDTSIFDGVSCTGQTVTVNGDKVLIQPGTYSDSDGFVQTEVSYQIALATDPTFSAPVYDSGWVEDDSWFAGIWRDLLATTNYLGRVAVGSVYDRSDYTTANAFTTGAAATTFFTDFSETPVGGGKNLPPGWIVRKTTARAALDSYEYTRSYANAGRDGWGVVDDATRIGDKKLSRYTISADVGQDFYSAAVTALGNMVHWSYWWTAPGDAVTDGRFVARIKSGSNLGILFRSAYLLRVQKGTTNDFIRLATVPGDSVSDFGSSHTFDLPFRLDETEWIYIRGQFVGTALKAKAWKEGEPEPSAWQIEETDATYASGYFGIAVVGNQLLNSFDFLAAEVGGASDPWPPAGTTAPSTPSIQSVSVDAYGSATAVCSAYSGDGDHLNTRWQVDLQSGSFVTPLVDTQLEADHLLQRIFDTLPVGDYKVRCLHRSAYELESSWSSAYNFSVATREDPAVVSIVEVQGDPWTIQDLGDIRYYGMLLAGWSATGPGGSGGASTVHKVTDGRYARHIHVGGTNFASTEGQRLGVDLNAFLNPTRPDLPYVMLVRDWVKFERASDTTTRTGYWGVAIEEGNLNLNPAWNSGHEAQAIGFRTSNGGNWRAYFTSYRRSVGGGSLIVNVDTLITETSWALFEIQLDAYNRQIRWYVNGTLLHTHNVQASEIADFDAASYVGGAWGQGPTSAFRVALNYKAYPIVMPLRVTQELAATV